MSYLSAAGQIRALEKKLLDATDVERMVDANDAAAAFKVFNDTDLADNLLDVKMEEYKKALNDDLKQTKEFLSKVTPDKNLVRLIFIKYDFHNIKLLFKAKFSGQDLTADLADVGMIDKEGLKKYILDDDTKVEMPEDIKKIIEKGKIDFGESPTPSEIDMTLDKEYFGLSLKLAKKIGSNFILDFVQKQIDAVNIKTLLRAKALSLEASDLKRMMIDGGKVEVKELMRFLEKDIEELIRFLKGYLTRSQEKFLSEYDEKKNLWQLEKGFDNLDMDFVKRAKRTTAGPELILAYWWAKENAIRNVRLIMTGKLNGIPADEIKQRVRDIF